MFGLAHDRNKLSWRPRRGVTLMESLIASALLAMIVIAVGAAVSTGRKVSLDGQMRVLAAMAADDLISELSSEPYAQLALYDGLAQPVGAISTLDGQAYPSSYWMIGRNVRVYDEQIDLAGLGVSVLGKRIIVTAVDDQGAVATVEAFVPEPAL